MSENKGKRVVFVMLNPSTADATLDDPTIRRCMGFASRWGFDRDPELLAALSPCGRYRYRLQRRGVEVVNLFALRSTDPRVLYDDAEDDPVGPDNDEAIATAVRDAGPVVCAWGNHGRFMARGLFVRELLGALNVKPWCFRLTKQGQPEHPLYQPWLRQLVRLEDR